MIRKKLLSVISAAVLGMGGAAVAQTQIRPSVEKLPVPPGATREQLHHGDRVFHGEAARGQCSVCHGVDAKGTANGNDLTTGFFVWGDGSMRMIRASIQHNMRVAPGMDGDLKEDDVEAVAVYLWALSKSNRCPTTPPKPGETVRTDCPLP